MVNEASIQLGYPTDWQSALGVAYELTCFTDGQKAELAEFVRKIGPKEA